MRRTALALTTLAAGLAGTVVAVAPAQAAEITEVNHLSYTGMPADWQAMGIKCDTGARFSPSHVTYNGRGALKVGDSASIAIAAGADTTEAFLGAELTYASPDGQPVAVGVSFEDEDGDFAEGEAFLRPTAAGAWTTADLAATSFDFYTGNYESDAESDLTGTIAQMFEQTPALTNPTFYFTILTDDCDAFYDSSVVAGAAYVDRFSVTAGTAEVATRTTWDFEAQKTPTVAITAGRSAVTYGASTTLSTLYRRGGVAVKDVRMQLLARRAGESSFRAVATVATDSNGRARYSVRPVKNTSYLWKAPQSPDTVWRAQQSTAVTVAVRPKVSLALNDSTVRKGTKIYAYGTVAPAKGQSVTVYRKAGSRLIKLGTTTSNTQGKYRVYFTPTTTGTWTILTRVAPKSGLATGESSTKTLTIS